MKLPPLLPPVCFLQLNASEGTTPNIQDVTKSITDETSIMSRFGKQIIRVIATLAVISGWWVAVSYTIEHLGPVWQAIAVAGTSLVAIVALAALRRNGDEKAPTNGQPVSVVAFRVGTIVAIVVGYRLLRVSGDNIRLTAVIAIWVLLAAASFIVHRDLRELCFISSAGVGVVCLCLGSTPLGWILLSLAILGYLYVAVSGASSGRDETTQGIHRGH
jgi:hypothetical protein